MLDLQTRIGLDEDEFVASGVQKEFKSPEAAIGDPARHRYRGVAHGVPHGGRQARARRHFDDLLMPALDRAFALAEVHDRLSVADDLNLDMTHALPITLDIERIHSEGRLRFGLAALPGGSEFAAVAHDAHATPAAAGHRLDYDRLAGAEPVEKGLGVLQGRSLISTLQHGNTTFARELARRGLVAEQFEGFGRRADEGQPGRSESAREICIFRQEAVARMNGVAAGVARRFDDRVDGEIGRSALARQLTRLVACKHMA